MNALGWYYEQYEKDYGRAVQLWEQADALGSPDAAMNLGVMHSQGLYPGRPADQASVPRGLMQTMLLGFALKFTGAKWGEGMIVVKACFCINQAERADQAFCQLCEITKVKQFSPPLTDSVSCSCFSLS